MAFARKQLVSVDALTALTEFDVRYMQALQGASMEDGWALRIGYEHRTGSLVVKWPINLDGAGFKKFIGDPQYRDLHSAFVELSTELFHDGVAELKRVIEAPEWIGWQQAPENMAKAKAKKPAELVASILAKGETTDCFDGKKFFATSKPFNPKKTKLGTYDNLVASKPIHGDSIAYWREHFRKMKNASGKNLGLRLTGILCPPSQEEAWRDVLESDLIIQSNGANDFGTVTNRYKGACELIVGNQLEDVAGEEDYYYPIAQNVAGLEPWVVLVGEDEENILDTSSAMYEQHKKVGYEATLELGAGLTIPQAIARAKTGA